MDHFALLQEPRRPGLIPIRSKPVFCGWPPRFHPDKSTRPRREKAAANDRYAELNSAYHCLLEPKERLRHLLELESGAPPKDVQSLPPGTMDLLVEIGQICRETDLFLAARSKTASPLLKVRMFETGMAWTGKLNQLRQRIDLRREELLAELKSMNAAWNAAPPPVRPGAPPRCPWSDWSRSPGFQLHGALDGTNPGTPCATFFLTMIFLTVKFSLFVWMAVLASPLAAQTTWQEEFAKMPLTEKVSELNRHNCVKVMLGSLQRNPAVKALIFMPGATDEFYFFRRARAALTNSAPTLLDAVSALTNQTYIRATLRPPFLLMRTDEDPLEPDHRHSGPAHGGPAAKKTFRETRSLQRSRLGLHAADSVL